MGNPDRPELGAELTNSFCRTDPDIASHFARVTFLPTTAPTCRAVRVPTLILQCREDAIAPPSVGAYVHARDPGEHAGGAGRHRALPEPERARGDGAAIKAFLGSP